MSDEAETRHNDADVLAAAEPALRDLIAKLEQKQADAAKPKRAGLRERLAASTQPEPKPEPSLNPTLADLYADLADSLSQQGRHGAAERWARQAISLAESQRPADPGRVIDYVTTLGRILRLLGRDEEAEKASALATEILARCGPHANAVLRRREGPLRSQAALDEAVQSESADRRLADVHAELASTLYKERRVKGAATEARRGVEIAEALPDLEPLDLAVRLGWLGVYLAETGERDEAREIRDRVAGLLASAPPDPDGARSDAAQEIEALIEKIDQAEKGGPVGSLWRRLRG